MLPESAISTRYGRSYSLHKSGWLTDEEGNRHPAQRNPFSSERDAKKFLAKSGTHTSLRY